jgi:alcohol dehydrogenase class IV
VIGAPEHRFKASLRSEHLLARVALVDPELHVKVSPEVTARTCMDALTQCIEAYTSKNANPITDALALRGIELASRSLVNAFKAGANLDAREDMALAALLSGITLTNAGLGAVHGFAAPMGARFPIPHGTVCAILLLHCTRANVEGLKKRDPQHPVLKKYADVARLMGEVDLDAALSGLSRELRIPTLSQFEFREEHIAETVAVAKKANSMKSNPVELSDAELAGILRAAL